MNAWWKEKVIYQIYPRSFYDSNDDGIGDIPGIIMKLDELKDLGIGVIWLSPVYKSPNKDNGYDVSNYREIHHDYGTMSDFDSLVFEAKKRDIKIVMDLVINHTSDQHEWFQKSRNRIEPYTDYYIWKDGINESPPNNWTSFFSGKAWQFDEDRKQYYLHLFAKEQPDLNYDCPRVLEEVKDVITFWLEKGVSGFRCDVINIIYKSTFNDGKKQLALKGLEHYLNQEGNHEILRKLRRDIFDKYDCFTVGETILVNPKTARDLCAEERKELNMIFSFEHMEVDQYLIKWLKHKFKTKKFFMTLSKWQNELTWNANYFESHDQLRSVSRFGNDGKYWQKSAKMLSLLLLSLKGTPFVFQGQEIGMTNFDFKSMDEIRDLESKRIYRLLRGAHIPSFYRWIMIKRTSRDNVRTPLQWNSELNGGFTKGVPWLGVNKNFSYINYSSQKEDSNSILSFYKKMIKLRNEDELLIYGGFKHIFASKRVYVFERFNNNKKYTVIINISKRKKKVPHSGDVIISNYDEIVFDGKLKPFQAVIIK